MFIILLVVALCTGFYFYRRQRLNYFAKLGIKGPTPNFLFGNLNEYRKTLLPDLMRSWGQRYGKVFGYYEGPTPVLVIGDPDLLQEVLVKQFSNFHGRKVFPIQPDPDGDSRVNMFFARGKRWKRIRTTINPAFSESKMRKMYPMIGECITSMISLLKDKIARGQGEMNIQESLQRMTMDIICKCAFGVETNCQTNINHPFIVSLKRFTSSNTSQSFNAAFIMTFPELRNVFLKFLALTRSQPANNPDILAIRAKVIEVIEARRKSGETRSDLLQLMLDAEMPGTSVLDEDNLCPMNNISSLVKEDDSISDTTDQTCDTASSSKKTSAKGGKPMTTEEIIQQANLFLFAGYGTSSTAMSFLMHSLAEHRDVQKKLQEEIDNAFKDKDYENLGDSEFYEIISKLPYLTAVIFELLRFHPFVTPVVTRMCLKSEGTYLSNGLFISNGLSIVPNAFVLHFDKDIWTGLNPKLFAPERFLHIDGDSVEFVGPPHPFAWIPFGAGPRNCIGQRFAMMVMKSTVARFFKQFTVEATDKTEFPIQLRVGPSLGPKNGVFVRLLERTAKTGDQRA